MAQQKQSVYEIVTERILTFIEKEKSLPWTKPWVTRAQCNYKSKKPYNGINILLTGMQGYKSPYWLTYNQAKEMGGQVRKGEKATPIVFWNILTKESEDGEEEKKFGFHRLYYVFNAEQIDGIEFKPLDEAGAGNEPIGAAEKVVAESGMAIDYGYEAATYNWATDEIQVPALSQHPTAEDFYSTLFHEMAHATGHKSRLNRPIENAWKTDDYSKEELVAEMASAFVLNVLGLDTSKTDRNSAAYVKGWAKRLGDEPRMIVSAGNQASKAADWLLKK